MKHRYVQPESKKLSSYLIALFLLLFLFNQSKAQLVYIPDANFRAYISSLDPTAMIGDSLDPGNSTVTSVDMINIQPQGIQNLSGIEYFIALRRLECYDNALNTLNAVPFSLDTLLIENAAIGSLPALPNSMLWLGCGNCLNLSGFSNLPSSLLWLGISGTGINNLILGLPSGLQFLECVGTPLFDLPPLPQSLLLLNCQSSSLSCLPMLPDNMLQLHASFSGVTCLPNIPSNPNFTSDIGTSLCNGFFTSGLSQTPISCPGFCDGELLAATSSSTALDYYWSNGFSDLNNSGGVSGINGLCAGNYSVTIIPTGGGCVTQLSSILSQPIQAQLGQPTINPMSCLDDSTWVYYPGNPPYNFQWSNGAVGDSVYLPAGNYSVSVSGVPTCAVLPASFIVSATVISVTALGTNVTCNGNNDGSITVIATGGIPPYQYSINGIAWQSSGVFTNLLAGNYTIAAMDSNGCVGTTNTTILQPAAITINAITSFATCGLNDGSITINVNGGVAPYIFSIDSGITNLSLNVFNNIASGVYIIRVMDANGCTTYIQMIVSSTGGPVINNLLPANATCYNSNNGSITATVSGGTLPYQYSVDAGVTMQSSNIITNLNAGSYMVAVSDAGGCWTTANTVITSPSLISVFTTVNNATCNGTATGSACANASGGVGGYTYLWSNASTNQCQVSLPAGIYTVTVTDVNGCSNTATTTVSEPPPLSFGNILSNYLVCNANPVNICFTITGGTPGYTYLWSQGSITNCISALPGVYTITVVDANGCSISSSTSVTYTPGWQFVSLDNITLPTCGICDGTATAVMINTQAASYQWIPGNFTGATNPQLCDNTDYMLIAVDTGGCVDTLNFSLSCHSVWPGDANNDGQADNTDLLAIGIGYGATGAIRSNPTINWQGEIGFDWTDSLASGTNYKHIDCNGDGIIADDDTTAIIQNFGLTHPLHPSIITPLLTDPPLYFDLQIDSASVDTVLQIPLMLGSAAIPADSIYGIAFTVSYDTALVKADSVTMNFMTSWLNSATGHILGIAINDPLNGKLYGAVTRTSHTDTSGFGELGRLGIVTVDNISARMTSLYSDTLVLGLSDVIMISHNEDYKTVNIIIDSLIINDNTVGISENTKPFTLNVYPNPANRFLFIDYDAQIKNPTIALHSIFNEEVKINYKASNGKAIIDLGTIANGIYLLSVTTDKGIITRKINVLRP